MSLGPVMPMACESTGASDTARLIVAFNNSRRCSALDRHSFLILSWCAIQSREELIGV